MLDRLVAFALNQKVLVVAMTLLVAGLGMYALNTIPIDAFPDVTNVQVQVLAESPGLSPLEVERLVTRPIESELNGLPRVTEVRSVSRFGLCVVTVVFEDNVDTYFARQLVLERLQRVKENLPATIPEPTLGPITTGMGEIYQYFLESDSLDLMGLRTIQDWVIKPQLRSVPGVTEVNSFGGIVKQYQVLVEPAQLLAYGLTLDDVFGAVERNNSVAGGNYLEHASEQYIIRGIGLAQTIGDLENITVKSANGVPVRVKDVARVDIGSEVRQGAVVMQGRGEVVAGIVMMLKGENSRQVIERVKAKVAEINKSLPPHVRMRAYYDQTELVGNTLATVRTNLIEGGILVIAILLLFMGDVRGGLIVASSIPLSMLFAFIGMRWAGLSANLMSLGAIDFGMVVDGSVVMVENFERALRTSPPEWGRREVIARAAREVARPIVFGVLIIMAVYLPILTLQGIEGKMFVPMALTVIMALAGSLVLTLVFVPVVSALLLKRRGTHREPRFVGWLRGVYLSILNRALRHRLVTLLIAVGVLALSFVLVPHLGSEFVPELDEGAILIQPIRMPSISLTESIAMEKKVQQVIMQFPEVEFVVGRLGRADIASDPMGVNLSDVYVTLKPRSQWTTARSKEELVRKITAELRHVPGVNYNVTQPIAMRVDELVSGVKSDIAVKLFGDDLTVLKETAAKIAAKLESVPGAADVGVEQIAGQPYLNIYIDHDAIARYGLNVSDVQNVIEIAIGGKVATQLFEQQVRFGVAVRYPERIRGDLQAIENSLVALPGGGAVPLRDVARVVAEEGPVQVSHESGRRRIAIECNVRERDLGGFVSDARRIIETDIPLPAGYELQWGGQFENQVRATQRLVVIVPISILIIFLLLFSTFGRVRDALLILLNLPVALSGGIFALFLRGLHLSVSAYVGFIALFGVAVLNGVVLITHLNELAKDGQDRRRAILTGASDRLRPVLMTALVASLGFVPMAFSEGTGAEVQRPLATVVIGGLVTSTLLTLFVLPAVYHWLEERRPTDPGRD